MAEPVATESSEDVGRARRARTQKFLPSDRIRFLNQAQLLRAYGTLYSESRAPVTNQQAGAAASLTASTTSLLNAFFVENALLAKGDGGGFVPAAEVVSYANAHAFHPETAGHKLRPLLGRTWFAQALLPMLRMSPRIESEALAVLADASGAAAEHRAQLSILLDYLAFAGLLEREDGSVRVTRPVPESEAERPTTEPADQGQQHAGNLTTGFRRDSAGGIQFSVELDVSMAEFATWHRDRIEAFFSGLAQVLAAKRNLEEKGGAREKS